MSRMAPTGVPMWLKTDLTYALGVGISQEDLRILERAVVTK